MLLCQLGFEVGIAHVRVIEVVEGWVTVTLFVEGIEAEVNELRRAVGEEQSWSQLCVQRLLGRLFSVVQGFAFRVV